MTSFTQLPPNARRYLDALAHFSGSTTWIVSVGPRRDQTIIVT
jgi:adenylosuccinate synthase